MTVTNNDCMTIAKLLTEPWCTRSKGVTRGTGLRAALVRN